MGSCRVGHDWSDLAAAAAGLSLEFCWPIGYISQGKKGQTFLKTKKLTQSHITCV